MRVLVTVKAYPQPSRTYGETVCVAGIRIDANPPTWLRLYPVAYRDLAFADQFRKYQIVELRAFRSPSDQRPESYKPNIQSLKLRETVGTDNGRWLSRWNYVSALAGATTACELLGKQGVPGAASLGLIKPRIVEDLEIESNDEFDDDKRRIAELAAAGDLFKAGRSVLEPAPYRLKYLYTCMYNSCKGHRQTLIDWEAGQAARSWRSQGYAADQIPGLLRRKFLDEMCADDRDTFFYLGNQHQYPGGFLVLGVFWPPVGSRPAPALFF